MSLSALPLDDIRALLEALPPADLAAAQAARQLHAAELGEAAAVREWLAGWSGQAPAVRRPLAAIFAGTHQSTGAAQRNAVVERVALIAAGRAPVNRLCSAYDIGLKLFDLALQLPAGDIRNGPALDERSAAATIAFGMEAVAGGIDLLCLGDCGSDASPGAAAIFALLEGEEAVRWSTAEVADAAEAAVRFHGAARGDPLEALRRLGGRETCALAGAILAARVQHVPVILDGAAALAAALVLSRARPGATDHCRLGAAGNGGPLAAMSGTLGMAPLLRMNPGAGEGAGAVLAAGVVKGLAAVEAAPATTQDPGTPVER